MNISTARRVIQVYNGIADQLPGLVAMFQADCATKPSVVFSAIGRREESPPHWFSPQCSSPSKPKALIIQNSARASISGLSRRQSCQGLYG